MTPELRRHLLAAAKNPARDPFVRWMAANSSGIAEPALYEEIEKAIWAYHRVDGPATAPPAPADADPQAARTDPADPLLPGEQLSAVVHAAVTRAVTEWLDQHGERAFTAAVAEVLRTRPVQDMPGSASGAGA